MTPRARFWLARRLNDLAWRLKGVAVSQYAHIDNLDSIARSYAIVVGLKAENEWRDRYFAARKGHHEGTCEVD